jgi:NADPH-dependent curcumin reductase
MTEIMARRYVLAARPSGEPKPTDFRLATAPLPPCPQGGVRLRGLYLSLDPYMRGRMDDRESYARPMAIGEVMAGETVSEVMESDHPAYVAGDIVLARTGWTTHAISDGLGFRKLDPGRAPITTGLGVLGMPGFTAYAGLTLIGKPQPGETVVVAAATGPVGSLVGQLARLAGARAVGIAGGGDKCRYLLDELKFDAALDHRAPDFAEQLRRSCPDGIDVYFENVGGQVWQAVLPLLNKFARVPVCGLIAHYSGSPPSGPDLLPATMREILSKSLTLRGFINFEFAEAHYATFLNVVSHGLSDETITFREDVYDGIESAPAAFIGMLRGQNFGKVLIRL